MEHHQSTLLQHMGIVAGVCDEIRLAALIDAHIEQPRRKVSVGQAVKAMILNALEFSGRALYLNPRFYENPPVEVLIGEGVTAADVHDASLGSALEALYAHGIAKIFYRVASAIWILRPSACRGCTTAQESPVKSRWCISRKGTRKKRRRN